MARATQSTAQATDCQMVNHMMWPILAVSKLSNQGLVSPRPSNLTTGHRKSTTRNAPGASQGRNVLAVLFKDG